ncbi:hypothetical protein MHBO_003017, partial [Bonamia ostreae]
RNHKYQTEKIKIALENLETKRSQLNINQKDKDNFQKLAYNSFNQERINVDCETTKIEFDLLCQQYDLVMKKITDKLILLSKNRFESMVSIIKDITLNQINYHKNEFESWGKLNKILENTNINNDLEIFSKENTKEIEKIYLERNMLEIYENEKMSKNNEKYVPDINTLEYNKIKNLYSFNSWGKNGFNNVVNGVNNSFKDTSEYIRLLTELKNIIRFVRDRLNNFLVSKNKPEENSNELFNETSGLIWDYMNFESRQLLKYFKYLEDNLFNLKYTKNLLKSTVKSTKIDLKTREKFLNKINRKIDNLIDLKMKSELNVKKLSEEYETKQTKLKSVRIDHLMEASLNLNHLFKNLCKHIEIKDNFESEYLLEKSNANILEANKILSTAYCMDLLQDKDKSRYLLTKSV